MTSVVLQTEITLCVHAEIERRGAVTTIPMHWPNGGAVRTAGSYVVFVMAGKRCLKQEMPFMTLEAAEKWLADEWNLKARVKR